MDTDVTMIYSNTGSVRDRGVACGRAVDAQFAFCGRTEDSDARIELEE